MLTLQITVASSYFIDTALEKHQILKKLFSDAKAEHGLSFEDRSSCNRINSWVFNNIISYFSLCLQKFNRNVLSWPIFLYSNYNNMRVQSNHYLQFATPDNLSRNVVFVPANLNETHWILLVVLPLMKTLISIDLKLWKLVPYEFRFVSFKTYARVHGISFKKEDRHYFNYQGILKQENQSNWDILDLIKAPAKTNNLLDIKFETVTVKWRYRFYDCCFRVFTETFITFISAYDRNLLETVKHSCCLLNNELTKVERQKIMMNFVTLWLIVQKKVFAELLHLW